ncbi:MAG: gliding motility-associated C-terminal domain-containing protein [Cryomorphaceae bacterium]
MRHTILVFCLLFAAIAASAEGFVRNLGQWDGTFTYRAGIPGGAIFLEQGCITFHLIDPEKLEAFHDRKLEAGAVMRHHAFKLRFIGANTDVHFEEDSKSSHYQNFYLGNDPARWQHSIHPAQTVIYKDLYDGIDLHVMLHDQTLKYEFHLEAGVDPSIIQLAAEGLDEWQLDREGNLIMHTSLQDIVELAPYAYQFNAKREFELDAQFVLEDGILRYDIEAYDAHLPLVIDPEVIFSTFSGSTSDNWGFTAAPDNNGFLYAGGIVFGTGYPFTTGAFDQSFNFGTCDVAITKYDTSGTQLIYSTYLGGNGYDHPHSLIVNSSGNLYVMGSTGSGNFPTSSTAFDRDFAGGPPVNVFGNISEGVDIFITAFNASGSSLIGSTYLGGSATDGLNLSLDLAYNYSDEFRGEINLDDDENVYVSSCTYSTDYPVLNGVDLIHNGSQDAVVTKLTPALTQIIWSTFLGGGGDEAAYGVDVATDGTIYVGGGTSSTNFPTTQGAYNSTYRGGRADGFITRLSTSGDTVLNSTFYGTTAYDQIYIMQLDRRDFPHFFGQTEHNGSQLIHNANWSNAGGGQILGVLEPDLSDRVWTTQFGSTPGEPNISPTAFLVDVCNSVYISGWGGPLNSNSTNNNASNVNGLQTTFDAFRANPDNDGSDFYLAVVAADGNSLVFGSFYGGLSSDDHVDGGTSRFDRGGQIYHSVCASCGGFDDFPVVPDPGAWSTTNNSFNCNNAVFKIDFELPIVVADFNIPAFACAPYTLNLQNNSVTQSNTSFNWNFGNGQTSTQVNPSVTYTTKGTYEIRLVVSDPTSCNLFDTLIREITIAQDTNFSLPDLERCIGESAVLGPNPNEYQDLNGATISWLPVTNLDDPSSLNPTATVTTSTLYRLVIDYGGCQERILQKINIDAYPITGSSDTIVCSSFDPFYISGHATEDTATYEWSDDLSFLNILSTDSTYFVQSLPAPLNYFYFRTTKNNGCQMIDTVLITVSDLDIELTADTTICKNHLTRITAHSENPLNTFAYYWSTGAFTSDPNEVLAPLDQNFLAVQLDAEETFYLRAIGIAADGCTAQDTVRVQVSALDASMVEAFAETDTFYRGQIIQLTGSPSGPGIDFYWTPNQYISDAQIANPTVQPKEAMMYIWVVSDSATEECTFRDTVFLKPFEVLCDTPEVFVPSAFSPDGDGRNDKLYARGKNIKEVEFSVFDRWGNEVFATTDPTEGWDGKYKGALADYAVYVYQLKATCITNEVYFTKGNVTLMK